MPRPTPTTRRSLLLGGLTLTGLALGGCSRLSALTDGSGGSSPSGTTTDTTSSPTSASSSASASVDASSTDADAALVEECHTLLLELAALAAAVAARLDGAQAAAARRLARLHRSQAALLAGATSDSAVPTVRAPASASKALTRLRGDETAARRRLTAAAVAADSGALARLLAGLAAGLSQAAVLAPLGSGADTLLRAPAVADLGTPIDAQLATEGVTALQDALAAEHAACWVYASLGAATSASTQTVQYEAVTAAEATHRARRDVLEAALRGAGEDPVGSAAAYDLPSLRTTARVRAEAVDLETGCAEALGYVVATTTGALRRWAVGEAGGCSRAALGFSDPARAAATGLLS
ncbi:DUF4439 domain-containing protein [Nocardioides sp. GY 10127]|uniref:DUF4439 domain-containing protein n=1 Tax=Nocardioides sp. GY 10127 TaxID=2569762 RepID=UPI0010A854F0|nr:DUF4439 domain-containing protein [Nocardioides sp. GY 10127]TIC80887.1 DUF4439 domain-containing protein [Nocardioides sp. GY 10127]